MKNKILMLLAITGILFSLSACGEETNGYVSGGTKDSQTTEEKVDKDVEEIEDIKEEEEEQTNDEKTMKMVKLYFLDDQAENLVEKSIEMELTQDTNLEQEIVNQLKVQPEDPNIYSAINEKININSVRVEGRLAKVDISKENLNGSSTEEMVLIDAIVAALTSLDSTDQVKFLVDGEEVETLMGHIDITDVFTKQDISMNIIKD